jgi:hypothetical protein
MSSTKNIDLMTIGINTVNFILGGYGIWKSGIFTLTQDLSPHYSVKFNLYIYLFDSTTDLTTSNLIVTINGPLGNIILGEESIKLI